VAVVAVVAAVGADEEDAVEEEFGDATSFGAVDFGAFTFGAVGSLVSGKLQHGSSVSLIVGSRVAPSARLVGFSLD